MKRCNTCKKMREDDEYYYSGFSGLEMNKCKYCIVLSSVTSTESSQKKIAALKTSYRIQNKLGNRHRFSFFDLICMARQHKENKANHGYDDI